MEDSILISIKKLLGGAVEDESFNLDLITAINTVLMSVRQFGVGKQTPFNIVDENSKWSDFAENVDDIRALKTYVQMKVRLMFDPPSNSTLIEAINNIISECEWRIYITENYNEPVDKEDDDT